MLLLSTFRISRINYSLVCSLPTQLKFITTLWSVDQIAQLITINDSRVHKMKNNEHKIVHSEILYIKRKAKNQQSIG